MGKENILFIGLGNMGLPMSSHLIKAGHTVYGTDLNENMLAQFKNSGGIMVNDLDEASKICNIVCTSLPSSGAMKND